MHDYNNNQMNEEEYRSVKNIGRAMEELENGLIKIVKPEEN